MLLCTHGFQLHYIEKIAHFHNKRTTLAGGMAVMASEKKISTF
jgi:hypothetical protein